MLRKKVHTKKNRDIYPIKSTIAFRNDCLRYIGYVSTANYNASVIIAFISKYRLIGEVYVNMSPSQKQEFIRIVCHVMVPNPIQKELSKYVSEKIYRSLAVESLCIRDILSKYSIRPSKTNTYRSYHIKDGRVGYDVRERAKTGTLISAHDFWALVDKYIPNRESPLVEDLKKFFLDQKVSMCPL